MLFTRGAYFHPPVRVARPEGKHNVCVPSIVALLSNLDKRIGHSVALLALFVTILSISLSLSSFTKGIEAVKFHKKLYVYVTSLYLQQRETHHMDDPVHDFIQQCSSARDVLFVHFVSFAWNFVLAIAGISCWQVFF